MEMTEKIMGTVKGIWFRSAEQSGKQRRALQLWKGKEVFFSEASCGDGLVAEVGIDLLALMGWVFISRHCLKYVVYGT